MQPAKKPAKWNCKNVVPSRVFLQLAKRSTSSMWNQVTAISQCRWTACTPLTPQRRRAQVINLVLILTAAVTKTKKRRLEEKNWENVPNLNEQNKSNHSCVMFSTVTQQVHEVHNRTRFRRGISRWRGSKACFLQVLFHAVKKRFFLLFNAGLNWCKIKNDRWFKPILKKLLDIILRNPALRPAAASNIQQHPCGDVCVGEGASADRHWTDVGLQTQTQIYFQRWETQQLQVHCG